MKNYDVIIIGSGIVGAFAARELSRYDLHVLVVDRSCDIGEGSTKTNSGILYPGFHPRGGSLKGISCVLGNAMYDAVCAELGVSMKRVGSLFVAFHPEGEKMLEEKYKNGLKNGTPGMEFISGEEARRIEPLLSTAVTKALYAPTTGIISPFELVMAVTRSAYENGVDFFFDTEVTGLIQEKEIVLLETNRGQLEARFIVNAAGENSDTIDGWVRPQDLIIKPRRGEYYIFDKQESNGLQHVIYQAQETNEGGTLIAPTIDGNLIAGPTSEDVRSYKNVETTWAGLAHIERVAKKIIPELDLGKVITNFAGLRANITNVTKEQKDFVIRATGSRIVSVLGIKNPGMTAAPYLAKKIVEHLQEQGLSLKPKSSFKANLETQKPFLQETPEKQNELLAKDRRYGRIVCRCEEITEGDIIYALHSPLPPKNISGLKKRLRVGMGRCQGAFCTPRIIEIIARETRCRPEEVNKYLKGSNYVKGSVRPW